MRGARDPARLAPLIFPPLLAAFAALYWTDEARYLRVLDEDGPVEWATAALLAAGAGLAIHRARAGGRSRRFYVVVAAVAGLAVLEEISWGQRLLGVESPDFFLRHSDQQETNLHNVFQQWTGLTTKMVAAIVLLGYGVVLPLSPRLQVAAARPGVPVPPRVLIVGFALGSLLMIDLPTFEEEEIAELFYALALVLLLGAER